ncbi:hypothetical protein [Sphingomonas koreensis]
MKRVVPTVIAAAAGLLLASGASAATCEESFAKKGNPVTGLRFVATKTVADVKPAVALGQMRGIAATGGYDIIVDEAEYGSLLIEQPMSGTVRAFPIEIKAAAAGAASDVTMEAKLRGGQLVKENAARTEMCGMLNRILGGKAGITAATRGKTAVSTAGPVAMNSFQFSDTIARDNEKNPAGVLLRYKGKPYTISGIADYVTRDEGTDAYRIGYRIPEPHNRGLTLPGAPKSKVDVVCYLAKGQLTYALQLKPGANIKLTGTVTEFDQYRRVIWLQDCRNAK